MAQDQFQIVPSVLEWARKRAGFTIEEMTSHFRNFADWEAGVGAPSYPQLEALAEKMKIPVAAFFFPAPPTTPPIDETFRTLPETALTKLPSKMRLLLRKAKSFQINISELAAGKNPASKLITRDLIFDVREHVRDMALAVRSYLDVSIEEQIAWSSDDEALKHWRDYVQGVGVFIFKDAFLAPEYQGFCLTDVEFPIIYVNNSCARTRQIFTIFHELAHLLFQTSGIDSADELATKNQTARSIEIACNAFAAEFLLPENEFQRVRRGRSPDEETAAFIASQYHVSRESVFRRFLDRGEIGISTYNAAARRWAAERIEGTGGNYYRTKLAYLGKDYVSLALKAYRQNRITENQLAQYLDVKPRNLGGLEELFIAGAAAA